MTELINSLKTFASSSTAAELRKNSLGQLRGIPLLNIGRRDSCSDSGFTQWRDAMRMVARLPGGLPPEFRIRLWESLSDRYMAEKGISWSRVKSKSKVPGPRDPEISDQIEKDLHRTGCHGFSSRKQLALKRVLTNYSRWNPSVGYCQGFNMIGAMILEMTDGAENLTLKILIFLIEGILPKGYFSGGLRGLAIDMAVFRELLKLRKPSLHSHLNFLRGGDENPPLTDVFTMHWFLTLFIHCLPQVSVFRIWDLVLLEGSEVLLRTALVLWAAIETRIQGVNSADEFYSVMGVVTREMLEFGLMEPNSLVKCIVSVGPFPLPGLEDLRAKHGSLIAQETPYKSFFLAKKELDALKRHYSAIKTKQKATTIILKGLEASTSTRAAGLRSNSLFIGKKTQVAASPKARRSRRFSSSGGSRINGTNNSAININQIETEPAASNNCRMKSNSITGVSNNNINSMTKLMRDAGNSTTKSKQVTMRWEKSGGKKFRKKRTPGHSSGTTTSSSTELCDDDENDEGSVRFSTSEDSEEEVWSETDKKWRKKPKQRQEMAAIVSTSEDDIMINSNVNKNGNDFATSSASRNQENLKRFEEMEQDLDIPTKEERSNSEPSILPKPKGFEHSLSLNKETMDPNDSQLFLEEMSKLAKSDSFYESMSQRICELQFQNLQILNNCVTEPSKWSLEKLEMIKTPLMSPINPIPSNSSILSLDLAVNSLGSNLCPSPRGSISSGQKSPLSSTYFKFSGESFDKFVTSEQSSSDKNQNKIPDILLNSSEGIETKVVYDSFPGMESNDGCAPGKFDSVNNFNQAIQRIGRDSENKPKFSRSHNPPLTLDLNSCRTDKSRPYFVTPISPYVPEPLPWEENSLKEPDSSNKDSDDSDDKLLTPGAQEDINTVIRENIAILQRLKLKPVSYNYSQGEDEDEFYNSSTSNSDQKSRKTLAQMVESSFSQSQKSSSVDVPTDDKSCQCNVTSKKCRKVRRRRSSGSLTRKNSVGSGSRKSSSSTSTASSTKSSSKKAFNPFPTQRAPKLRSNKYGLYSNMNQPEKND